MAEFEWKNFLNIIMLVMIILIIILIVSRVLVVNTEQAIPLSPLM